MRHLVNGEPYEPLPSDFRVTVLPDRVLIHTPEGVFSGVAVRRGDQILISYRGRQFVVENALTKRKSASLEGSGELRAPMPGQIVDVLVASGATVTKGDKILVLEAMKTQQAFTAPFDGVVTQVHMEKGQQVADGELLALITKNS